MISIPVEPHEMSEYFRAPWSPPPTPTSWTGTRLGEHGMPVFEKHPFVCGGRSLKTLKASQEIWERVLGSMDGFPQLENRDLDMEGIQVWKPLHLRPPPAMNKLTFIRASLTPLPLPDYDEYEALRGSASSMMAEETEEGRFHEEPLDVGHGVAVLEESKQPADERRRIYILGVGNIGRLYAMCLAKNTPRPPITLVVHRRALLEHWVSRPGIELTRHDGRVEKTADPFDVEWWTDARPDHGPVAEPAGAGGRIIANLIVATKAADALPQVDRLRRYLDGGSAVAFTQNGMCPLWPPLGDAYVRARFTSTSTSTSDTAAEEEEKGGGDGGGGTTLGAPGWMACVNTHGVTSSQQGGRPFASTHASPGGALVGPVLLPAPDGGSSRGAAGETAQMRYLAGQIADAPGLAARRVSRRELWLAQLEKLVVNAVINPLTAVLRCRNGELFLDRDDRDSLAGVIDALLDEASRTLTALIRDPSSGEILAEETPGGGDSRGRASAADLQHALERFSFERLRRMVLDVGVKVADNTSSMLQDIRAGKQTEIGDFNGWLVETANSG
ncbi:ketopantoate reductase PanE/ApbA C terminal-domain-containing protein [Xylariaceae sp. FL0804]|nr:ketopantoate reductase PanE/ApbA C terminal-domain-containing protein [Xylariaceae sp. FL0804]